MVDEGFERRLDIRDLIVSRILGSQRHQAGTKQIMQVPRLERRVCVAPDQPIGIVALVISEFGYSRSQQPRRRAPAQLPSSFALRWIGTRLKRDAAPASLVLT